METVQDTQIKTAQQRFDEMYISSSEICQELKIPRSTLLHARRRGQLPNDCVYIAGQYFWERATARRHIEAWKVSLVIRRRPK